jgi:hypothetical protein
MAFMLAFEACSVPSLSCRARARSAHLAQRVQPVRQMTEPTSKPQTSTGDFDCLRCALALTGGNTEQAPEHSHRCPLRDTGKDPQPKELLDAIATAEKPH